jgi:hypothetical protein
MADERKKDRFALRPDPAGWTVMEIWTAKPAVVAGVPQTGLTEDDAKHIAALLNKNARRGDASMRRKRATAHRHPPSLALIPPPFRKNLPPGAAHARRRAPRNQT